jgi:hypothetical protein
LQLQFFLERRLDQLNFAQILTQGVQQSLQHFFHQSIVVELKVFGIQQLLSWQPVCPLHRSISWLQRLLLLPSVFISKASFHELMKQRTLDIWSISHFS